MARQKNGLGAHLEYALFCLATRAMRAMSYESAVRFGGRIGALAAQMDRFNRPVAMRNLAIAFPTLGLHARHDLIRRTYANFGRFAAEWIHQGDLNPRNVGQYVAYEGLENLKHAEELSQGRGVLVLTAHFGNIELLPQAHALHGGRIAIVGRPLRNQLIAGEVDAARTRVGNLVIARKGAGRAMLRQLAEGWQVAVALDLDVRHGVFVDFFSLKASTSSGLAHLAMSTGAPVLPAFMVRDGISARHKIRILPPVETVADGRRDESIRENTQRFTRVIETIVRSRPDHWNWIHRRWKTRPPGEPRFY